MRTARSIAVGLSVLGANAVTACTGGASDRASGDVTASPDGAAGDAAAAIDDPSPVPQVLFEGRLEADADDACDEAGPLFTIGGFTSESPIRDGEVLGGSSLRVTCAIKSDGAGAFDVEGWIFLAGAAGGQFRISGKLAASGEQSGIDGGFSRAEGESYEQQDGCVVHYPSAFQGVAPGRVWGEIRCPSATRAGASCRAIAQFRFENCSQ
ncbi:MAG: hypothetical protein KF894_13570 [Labilithrix sp.]|nr:hypothetical protein [Labilithrix sp.]